MQMNLAAWTSSLAYIIAAALLRYVLPWLKAHAELAKTNASMRNVGMKAMLLARVKELALSTMVSLAESKLPEIANKITTGQIRNSAQIQGEMNQLVLVARDQVVGHFKEQDMDIIQHLGADAINIAVMNSMAKVTAPPQIAAIINSVTTPRLAPAAVIGAPQIPLPQVPVNIPVPQAAPVTLNTIPTPVAAPAAEPGKALA